MCSSGFSSVWSSSPSVLSPAVATTPCRAWSRTPARIARPHAAPSLAASSSADQGASEARSQVSSRRGGASPQSLPVRRLAQHPSLGSSRRPRPEQGRDRRCHVDEPGASQSRSLSDARSGEVEGHLDLGQAAVRSALLPWWQRLICEAKRRARLGNQVTELSLACMRRRSARPNTRSISGSASSARLIRRSRAASRRPRTA